VKKREESDNFANGAPKIEVEVKRRHIKCGFRKNTVGTEAIFKNSLLVWNVCIIDRAADSCSLRAIATSFFISGLWCSVYVNEEEHRRHTEHTYVPLLFIPVYDQ